MSTVNNNAEGGNLYSIGDAVQANPAKSDTQEMENNFIALMVAQIRNQDPTKPVDSTEFLNQFSAMSQVKSMENMAATSKSNLVLMDNLQTLTAAGLVGQEVSVEVQSLELAKAPVRGQINLQHAAGKTALALTDSTGKTSVVQLGSHASGPFAFEIDPQALGLAPGQYQVEVETDSGEYPQVEIKGTVSHVHTSAEGPVLDVAGAGAVPFYLVTSFGQAQAKPLL